MPGALLWSRGRSHLCIEDCDHTLGFSTKTLRHCARECRWGRWPLYTTGRPASCHVLLRSGCREALCIEDCGHTPGISQNYLPHVSKTMNFSQSPVSGKSPIRLVLTVLSKYPASARCCTPPSTPAPVQAIPILIEVKYSCKSFCEFHHAGSDFDSSEMVKIYRKCIYLLIRQRESKRSCCEGLMIFVGTDR